MEDDGDLPLQNHEHHRVLVGAAHALRAVALEDNMYVKRTFLTTITGVV